jgi:hypothetical protein
MDEKVCTKCKYSKHISEFHKSKRCCKSCYKNYYILNWHKRIYFDVLRRKHKHYFDTSDISPEFILELFKKQNGLCYWFGIPMIPALNRDPASPTLDRLDANKGYTKDNVVLACYAANVGRNITNADRFREFVETLKLEFKSDKN